MPTATRFVYPGLFPFCVENKTTTQLNAMAGENRYEDASLANIMALWWNLYSLQVAATVTGHGTQTYVGPMYLGDGDVDDPWNAYEPRDRMAVDLISGGPHIGITWRHHFEDAPGDVGSGIVLVNFKRVYYNTTTAKYALSFVFWWNTNAGNVLVSSGYGDSNGTPSVTNVGTVTFLGQAFLTKRTSAMPNTSIVISSPVYWTY